MTSPGAIGSWIQMPSTVLDVLPFGMIVTDGNGEVEYQNAVAAELLDKPGSKKLKKRCAKTIEQSLEGREKVKQVNEADELGSSITVSGHPIVDGGAIVGAVVVLQDTTTEHKLDTVRSDFVANISHELRTPVGAIGVLAEALNDAKSREVTDRLAGRIQSEALRLGEIIEDLLNLSWLESKHDGEFSPESLDEVLRTAIDRTSEVASKHSIEIEYSADVSVSVPGERSQLVSVFVNLIDNALKHSTASSKVIVDLRVEVDESAVEVDVTNFGTPISESDIERIFERFYRTDVARSRNTGGSGLGLAIVRHIVDNHNGKISVRSDSSKTVFTVRLPLVNEL